jgi:hypothetical protein
MKLILNQSLLLSFLLFFSPFTTVGQTEVTDFLEKWTIEDQSAKLAISVSGDTLEFVTPKGLTMWYNERLTGNYEISYHISMLLNGGKYDRLSDLNCFWAANDPLYPNALFTRKEWRNGVFANYNTLNLFYVGYGGNYNTSTRFRQYKGEFYGVDAEKIKPVLKEYTDPSHLLVANQWYHITIRVEGDKTTFLVNDEVLFSAPLTPKQGDGHFGLRLLENHIRLTNFRVSAI